MITDTSLINIQQTTNSRLSELDFDNLKFGKQFSDHMFVADYNGSEWTNLSIIPYGNISLSPATSLIHYGQSIFEGMKAYRNENNKILTFRPTDNLKRLNLSAERMCMPTLPEDIFMSALQQLLQLDVNWIPQRNDQSLYIRPFMFATDAFLGVRPSETYRFMIITSPSSSYYNEPVSVKIETEFSRAMEGGVGYAKAAGNYGASLYPARLAQKDGYHQLIWTDSKAHANVEEAGTMNIMFQINGTLITPKASSTILRGITRDSVLTLARDKGIPVEERNISIQEVVAAHQNGTLQDAFGVGTAATIAHIINIGYKGEDYRLPAVETRELSSTLRDELDGIKRGKLQDPHGWVVTW